MARRDWGNATYCEPSLNPIYLFLSSPSPPPHSGLLFMLVAFAEVSFPLLSGPTGLIDNPDTIDDIFRLCSRSVKILLPTLSNLIGLYTSSYFFAPVDHVTIHLAIFLLPFSRFFVFLVLSSQFYRFFSGLFNMCRRNSWHRPLRQLAFSVPWQPVCWTTEMPSLA